MNTIQLALKAGQAIWLDYIRRGMFQSGEMRELVQLGVSGLTANPTILEKAIIGSDDYDSALSRLARTGTSPAEIYETLAVEDIQATADLLRPLYDSTAGKHGYASLEISPLVAYDTEKTVSEGKRLFARLNRPNVMVKVPATEEGISAIRRLTADGVNVNVTLLFSLRMYEKVREAYIAGLEDLVKNGGQPSGIASVASFFLSRIDTLVDGMLQERYRRGEVHLLPLLGSAAVSSAKIAYEGFRSSFYGARFEALRRLNASVQRPLWASTGTKNPAYSDLKYVEPLIGPDTVNTLPLATIRAFLSHGRTALTVESDLGESKKSMSALEEAGISISQVTDILLRDGVAAFSDSYNKLLDGIEAKGRRQVATGIEAAGAPAVTTAVMKPAVQIGAQDIVKRIWQKDHTLWKPDPVEISNRLGWLTAPESMKKIAGDLSSFAREIRDAGYTSVVLLGMGGSSLGAEVIRQVFGSALGFPALVVLDSTVPEAVSAVEKSLDLGHTLFVVSSKSGTTTEPLALFRYFKRVMEKTVGKGKAGDNFVAITDPATPLVELAKNERFRRVFLNPADIGGRYSVLSLFGLVPAALLGGDIGLALDRSGRAQESCAAGIAQEQNPGYLLGRALGTAAAGGKDKLTLITSPRLASFGLWVEQLIAESTGKEGKGIVPVTGEPIVGPAGYSGDRVFIYIRLDGDDNASVDAAVDRLEYGGCPVTVRSLKDINDIWAEFYYWEFATAVAGALMKINPFDQPDVQKAKDATQRLLKEYMETGHLPGMPSTLDVTGLLQQASKGKYLAIMAYMRQTPEADRIFSDFRRKVVEKYHVATTLGYGPRFLHSTGQLHKGGPDEGIFIQVTTEHKVKLRIPGEPYSLAVVADAEAAGDLETLQRLGRQVALVHCPAGEKAVYPALKRALVV
jgi:transaldolase / glucose-6-phosphate isomerase